MLTQRSMDEKPTPNPSIDRSQILSCLENYLDARSWHDKWFSLKPKEAIDFEIFYNLITINNKTGPLSPTEWYKFILLVRQNSSPLHQKMQALIPSPAYLTLIDACEELGLQTTDVYFTLLQLNEQEHRDLINLFAVLTTAQKKSIQNAYKTNHYKIEILTLLIQNRMLTVSRLLTISELFFVLDLEKVIRLLHDNNLLNPTFLDDCIKANNQCDHLRLPLLYQLHQTLTVFYNNRLLTHNNIKIAIQKTADSVFNKTILLLDQTQLLKEYFGKLPNDLVKFYILIDLLNTTNSLNNNTIQSALYFINSRTGFEAELIQFLTELKQSHFPLTPDNLELLVTHAKSIELIGKIFARIQLIGLNQNTDLNKLLKLRHSQLYELDLVTALLSKDDLLNSISFEKVIKTITTELPLLKESKTEKISRKKFGAKRSLLTINKKIDVYLQHNEKKVADGEEKYLGGSYGDIKKGYKTVDNNQPFYAMKRFKPRSDLTMKNVMHEARYLQFFGYKTYVFQREKKDREPQLYYLTRWKPGRDLQKYSEKEILSYPIDACLKWIISGLSDLNQLHERLRVHGDVAPYNLILNPKNATLRLNDFDTTRRYYKNNSSRNFAFSENYLPPNHIHYSFHTDVYSMGVIIAEIFPDIYSVFKEEKKPAVIAQIKRDNLSLPEQGIITLINAMTDAKPLSRCTIKDALQYTKELLANFDKLDDKILADIADKTIDHRVLSDDDALHRSYRARRG